MLRRHISSLTDRLSKAGIILSAICAVHCVVTPFLVAALPFLGMGFLQNKTLEYSILIPGVLLSSYITIRNYNKYHHDLRILLAVLGGFAIMLAGHMVDAGVLVENVMSVLGALIAGTGLYFNMRATHTCEAHGHAH